MAYPKKIRQLLCYNRYVTKKEDKQPQICYDVNNHKNT